MKRAIAMIMCATIGLGTMGCNRKAGRDAAEIEALCRDFTSYMAGREFDYTCNVKPISLSTGIDYDELKRQMNENCRRQDENFVMETVITEQILVENIEG